MTMILAMFGLMMGRMGSGLEGTAGGAGGGTTGTPIGLLLALTKAS